MVGKNKKELLKENSELKEELADITTKYDKLSERIKTLETELKCNKCVRTSENSTNVKKHPDQHIPLMYNCDKCRKEFDEEWKLNSHLKVCKVNKCDQCDKSFKYIEIKKKHVQISHENFKIYCHFFNNEKTCPYDAECVFLHEDSPKCKYGDSCERMYCMFKHEKKIECQQSDPGETVIINEDHSEKTEDFSSIQVLEVEIVNVDDHSVNDGNIDEIKDKNEENIKVSENTEIFDVNNKTDEHENNEKILLDNNLSGYEYKCLACDFKTNAKDDIRKHKLSIHNWCSVCFSTFSNHDKLNKHILKQHSN